MSSKWFVFSGLAMIFFASGCAHQIFEGTPLYRKPKPNLEVLRVQNAQDELVADLQRVDGRYAEIVQCNERLQRRVQELERQVAELSGRKQRSWDSEIDALRGEIRQLKVENASMRQQIVNDLASRIDKLAASHNSASRQSGRSQSSAASRGSGWEHKVERGQTLAEIARGYGVSMQSIIKANNLKNPSAIRVGQVLFIPDKK